jgi:hypothetical protein
MGRRTIRANARAGGGTRPVEARCPGDRGPIRTPGGARRDYGHSHRHDRLRPGGSHRRTDSATQRPHHRRHLHVRRSHAQAPATAKGGGAFDPPSVRAVQPLRPEQSRRGAANANRGPHTGDRPSADGGERFWSLRNGYRGRGPRGRRRTLRVARTSGMWKGSTSSWSTAWRLERGSGCPS